MPLISSSCAASSSRQQPPAGQLPAASSPLSFHPFFFVAAEAERGAPAVALCVGGDPALLRTTHNVRTHVLHNGKTPKLSPVRRRRRDGISLPPSPRLTPFFSAAAGSIALSERGSTDEINVIWSHASEQPVKTDFAREE